MYVKEFTNETYLENSCTLLSKSFMAEITAQCCQLNKLSMKENLQCFFLSFMKTEKISLMDLMYDVVVSTLI